MKRKSIQDFSIIHQHVVRAQRNNSLGSESRAFYYVVLGSLFDLQDDEIDEAIADNDYRVAQGDSPGKIGAVRYQSRPEESEDLARRCVRRCSVF